MTVRLWFGRRADDLADPAEPMRPRRGRVRGRLRWRQCRYCGRVSYQDDDRCCDTCAAAS
ncbi:hypothetical protein [Amycolatopsis suaedae]|uniref:Uncharacterized protein n=1 Tax=Amycolatopsis suaedae TaxID=2510978 RepID=A0A4Q7JBJ9_9PSEU|nr:hypothetical protein [Amycolatopsis suaedae]RZQ64667.1 hypothetical protein EWH70_07170 [Amycolatopsis suaedae]